MTVDKVCAACGEYLSTCILQERYTVAGLLFDRLLLN
jgi:hypothetical protein